MNQMVAHTACNPGRQQHFHHEVAAGSVQRRAHIFATDWKNPAGLGRASDMAQTATRSSPLFLAYART